MAFTSIRFSKAWNWGGLSFRQLMVRTYQAMGKHDTLNQAAVVAFYAMLSLVPLLGLVLALALGARTGVGDEIEILSKKFLPAEAYAIIRDQIHKIQSENAAELLSLSVLLLLWSASSLFSAIMSATSAAYGVRDERPWWKRQILAIALTIAGSILLVGAALCIALWPEAAGWLGSSGLARVMSTVVQWLVVVSALLAGFALAYYFGPNVEQQWEWITPGSAFGVLVLIAASEGFHWYIIQFGSRYNETYGTLAGVVLMMLWFYLTALALLVGAEINSVIERAAPHGKAPGQQKSPTVPPSI